MEIIPALIGWPALAAVVIPLLKNRRARGVAVYTAAAGMMALALAQVTSVRSVPTVLVLKQALWITQSLPQDSRTTGHCEAAP